MTRIKVKFKQKTYEFEIPKVVISTGAKEQLQSLQKNRFLAILLCVLGLFGLAGLHRLYVGKYDVRDSVLFDCWRFLYWNDL